MIFLKGIKEAIQELVMFFRANYSNELDQLLVQIKPELANSIRNALNVCC